jgi:hypothetical protein
MDFERDKRAAERGRGSDVACLPIPGRTAKDTRRGTRWTTT